MIVIGGFDVLICTVQYRVPGSTMQLSHDRLNYGIPTVEKRWIMHLGHSVELKLNLSILPDHYTTTEYVYTYCKLMNTSYC